MDGIPFTLMTPFPRKVFTDEDMEAPIKVLGTFPDINLVFVKYVSMLACSFCSLN